MISQIKKLYIGSWKFVVMADICRDTGMCLLDVYGVEEKFIEREDLNYWNTDELLSSLYLSEQREAHQRMLKNTKGSLLKTHIDEMKFLHYMDSAIGLYRELRKNPNVSATRLDRVTNRLKKRLYKLNMINAYTMGMVKQVAILEKDEEIQVVLENLKRSKILLAKALKAKLIQVELKQWRRLLDLPMVAYDLSTLRQYHLLYPNEWTALRSFVVERDYSKHVREFCEHFVSDSKYRAEVLRNETMTLTVPVEEKRAS